MLLLVTKTHASHHARLAQHISHQSHSQSSSREPNLKKHSRGNQRLTAQQWQDKGEQVATSAGASAAVEAVQLVIPTLVTDCLSTF